MVSPQRAYPAILPVPEFFEPEQVGQLWRVPYQERAGQARAWAAKHDIQPAAADEFRIALVMVDVQNTFCLPDYELFVAGQSGQGAVEDNRRLTAFLYRHLKWIHQIVLTLDTHHAIQIFHPVFIVDEQGNHPDPHTIISADEVVAGKWRFNPLIASSLGISPEAGQAHLEFYTRQLATREKFDLTIWPYHAMLGGAGHALVAAVEEAVFFHTIARYNQPTFNMKGRLDLSEHYSAVGPEILQDAAGNQLAEKDDLILNLVLENDMVIIAGQAKSHCVAWTVDDLLNQLENHAPEAVGKVYLLEDCSSPVVVPGVVDYTEAAEKAFSRFAAAGMQRVSTEQPLAEWPNLNHLVDN